MSLHVVFISFYFRIFLFFFFSFALFHRSRKMFWIKISCRETRDELVFNVAFDTESRCEMALLSNTWQLVKTQLFLSQFLSFFLYLGWFNSLVFFSFAFFCFVFLAHFYFVIIMRKEKKSVTSINNTKPRPLLRKLSLVYTLDTGCVRINFLCCFRFH